MVNKKMNEANDAAPYDATPHHHTLRDHFRLSKLKKLGWAGIILFVLHLLFHVVELLLIPFIIMIFS